MVIHLYKKTYDIYVCMKKYCHLATSDLKPGAIIALAMFDDDQNLIFYREFSPGKHVLNPGATKVHGILPERL